MLQIVSLCIEFRKNSRKTTFIHTSQVADNIPQKSSEKFRKKIPKAIQKVLQQAKSYTWKVKVFLYCLGKNQKNQADRLQDFELRTKHFQIEIVTLKIAFASEHCLLRRYRVLGFKKMALHLTSLTSKIENHYKLFKNYLIFIMESGTSIEKIEFFYTNKLYENVFESYTRICN